MSADATLWQFQDDFARALLDPDGDARLPDGIAALARQPGFAVYRNTTVKGCIDALQANYPAVARLVGDEWFRSAAVIYVRADPRTEPTLVRYGTGFADFLAAFEPARDLPYLPAVARLDRLWTEAHVARDDDALDDDRLAALARGRDSELVLRPHAAARWAWFDDQPIYTIWSRNRAGGPYDESEFEWKGEGALLTRPLGEVRWFGVDRAACAFLGACAGGKTLREALAVAQACGAKVDADAMFTKLVAAGAFGTSA